jgi:hypothetical protein
MDIYKADKVFQTNFPFFITGVTEIKEVQNAPGTGLWKSNRGWVAIIRSGDNVDGVMANPNLF